MYDIILMLLFVCSLCPEATHSFTFLEVLVFWLCWNFSRWKLWRIWDCSGTSLRITNLNAHITFSCLDWLKRHYCYSCFCRFHHPGNPSCKILPPSKFSLIIIASPNRHYQKRYIRIEIFSNMFSIWIFFYRIWFSCLLLMHLSSIMSIVSWNVLLVLFLQYDLFW